MSLDINTSTRDSETCKSSKSQVAGPACKWVLRMVPLACIRCPALHHSGNSWPLRLKLRGLRVAQKDRLKIVSALIQFFLPKKKNKKKSQVNCAKSQTIFPTSKHLVLLHPWIKKQTWSFLRPKKIRNDISGQRGGGPSQRYSTYSRMSRVPMPRRVRIFFANKFSFAWKSTSRDLLKNDPAPPFAHHTS